MATVKVRYLERRKLKGGTIGWVWNNRHAHAAGLAREWLGTDEAAAIARATQLNRQWDEARLGQEKPKGPEPYTVAWMADDIVASDEHAERRTKLRQDVEREFRVIAGSPLGRRKLGDITGRDIIAFRKALTDAKGVSKASETCKWLRHLLNVAKRQKLIAVSPMDGLRVPRPAARQIYWLTAEVETLIAKAVDMGRPSIALAIRLAFDTGQREGDVLKMRWPNLSHVGAGVEIVIQQSKTGATVRIPCMPELAAQLAATPRNSTHLVVSETTRRPYNQFSFVHRVAEVIEAAGFAGKRYSDLRRSAVMRLAMAGCTIPMIASITGHSYAHCQSILEVYLPRSTDLARAAIERVLTARVK